jgi:tetratricopeptide (TPR) repeat protein
VNAVSRARLVGCAVVAVGLGGLGFQGPFAGPGYELSLAAGLLCPGTAAAVTAVELAVRTRHPFTAFCRGVENGVLLALVAYLTALVHGFRAGFCDLAGGSMLFAMGPAVGMVLGGVWGAVAAELSWRRKRPRLYGAALGLALPIASVLVQVGFFYATPMVYAYDPFVGYFSGALYDTVLADEGLFEYRLASFATLACCYVVSLHLERREGRICYRSLGRPGLLAVGGALGLASAASVLNGPSLGQWQTEASIAEELIGQKTFGRCKIHYDIHIVQKDIDRFAADCDAHVTQIGAWLDIAVTEPITVYLFRDRGQKRSLMGAGRVSIAKPWRREIYLQNEEYPHGVMGHELVHAIAGALGAGPFKVAPSSLSSWMPNPGLVEGLAVAASPRDDNLGPHDWAAAMRAIQVLPTVNELFGLAFFAQSSSTAYTAAASFVDHVREGYGIDVIKRWYGGDDLEELTGTTWAALEQSWWQRLDGIQLSDAALATAKLRFDQPGVFDRACPHTVDELLEEAEARVGGDDAGALARFDRVLGLDPANVQARLGIARCRDKEGDLPGALAGYEAVEQHPGVTRLEQLSAAEKRADLLLREGDAEGAVALYRQVIALVTDEGRLRTLELKEHYAADPLARRAFVALLIGSTPDRGSDTAEALDYIGLWRASAPDDGTPYYLLARQHFGTEEYALAIERLNEALARKLPVPRSESESLRLLLIAACAIGDLETAKSALARYRVHPMVTESRAQTAASLYGRCSIRP